MKEIEVLFNLESDIKDCLSIIEKTLTVSHSANVIDTYFYRDDIENLRPNKDKRLLESLRVRDKGGKSYITHKKDNFNDQDVWLYSDELETEVSDSETIIKILETLGFSHLVTIDNTKFFFYTSEYEIVLEDVKKLGVFIEIEYIGDKKHEDHIEIENCKNNMRKYIDSLGLKIRQEENAGKPELMLRKISDLI